MTANLQTTYSGKIFLQQGLKIYRENRRDALVLTTIRDDTWNVLNMQHITLNSKRLDFSYIPGTGTWKD